MTTEQWKPIKGYENIYEVSDQGQVRSLGRVDASNHKRKEKVLKPGYNKGYFKVTLRKNGVRKYHTVHRLVAQAFIHNPENKSTVNHKNGIKDDNRVENLEWNTISENTQHAYDKGFSKGPKGEVNGQVKITAQDVYDIRYTDKYVGLSQREIGGILGVDQTMISCIKLGKNWKHITKDYFKEAA